MAAGKQVRKGMALLVGLGGARGKALVVVGNRRPRWQSIIGMLKTIHQPQAMDHDAVGQAVEPHGFRGPEN
jgi:hypothetical protein